MKSLRLAGVPLETRPDLTHHIDGDITVHYSPAEVSKLITTVEMLAKVEGVPMLRLASWFTHWVNRQKQESGQNIITS